MLATGHVALAVLCPARRLGLDLLRHPQDDRLGQLAVGSQRVTGVAQQAELHGEAEAVGVAASLADQRQVGVVEGVVADQVILAFRQRKQGVPLRGREDQATRHVSVVRAEVMVEGFPADVELAGKLRLGLAGRRSLPQGSSLLIGQGFLAAPVRATLLGQGDALTLPLADQGALELSEGPHHRQHQVGHRRVLASEHQALLQELDAHAALSQLLYQATQVIEVAGQPIHAVHHHCIAFADEAQQRFELGALGVLARCLVGEHLAHLGLFQLAFRVLVKAADPDVADAVPLHDVSLVEGGLSALSVPLCLKAHFCQAEIYNLRGHVSKNGKADSILTKRRGPA
uniref:Uncharacterized protein n=1 Tax=Escherichia coli TaxID=562 RepID=A0A3G4RQF4_ECOLX|nr:hypothetical protein D0358_00092 [Escherichia coli]